MENSSPPPLPSVCVIGAGPSGLAAVKNLADSKNFGKIKCLEKQPEVGGLWVYDDRTGRDESSCFEKDKNVGIHGSMYQNLYSNGPKECIEYADYTWKQHFETTVRVTGKKIANISNCSSFPPRKPVLDYIRGRHEKYLEKYVSCNCEVYSVESAVPIAPASASSLSGRTASRSSTSSKKYRVTYCEKDLHRVLSSVEAVAASSATGTTTASVEPEAAAVCSSSSVEMTMTSSSSSASDPRGCTTSSTVAESSADVMKASPSSTLTPSTSASDFDHQDSANGPPPGINANHEDVGLENKSSSCTSSKLWHTDEYDFIVVATGHFSTPAVPQLPGLALTIGTTARGLNANSVSDSPPAPRGHLIEVSHSHDFRNARQYAGKHVVVVGSSCSAQDVVSQLLKYDAKHITLAMRKCKQFLTTPWPKNKVTVRGNLCARTDGKIWFNKAESKEEEGIDESTVDAIILCTGYKHYFPFMEKSLRLQVESNDVYIPNLYKGVLLPQDLNIAYLGMQDQWFTFTMFDAQAAWFTALWTSFPAGNMKPTPEQVTAALAEDTAEFDRMDGSDSAECGFQADYIEYLYKNAERMRSENKCERQEDNKHQPHDDDNDDLASSERINGKLNYSTWMKHCHGLFMRWTRHKHANVLTYRDKAHVSFFSGDLAPKPAKTWVDDHSEGDYLAEYSAERLPTAGAGADLDSSTENVSF
ncbi:unnamed protein product [Amoebophrya sp. A120]|nr:unnamed protein product [Amoebophrya sp. A120]|eukprot:GSA120T00018640001.1